MTDDDIPEIVKKYRSGKPLRPRRDKISFWGALELDIDNIRITKKEADRSLEVIKKYKKQHETS